MTTLYQAEQTTDSPLARWRFEETSGTTFADDVGGKTATLAGSVTPGTSYPQPAYPAAGVGADFAGGYCSLASVSTWTSLLTIEALIWLDTIPASTRPAIFAHAWTSGQKMPLVLGINVDNAHASKLGLGHFNGTTWAAVSMTSSLATGVLHHIVGVYDGTTGLTIYQNGTSVATATVTARTSGTINATAYIGSRWDLTDTIDGRLFDLAVYNTALSSTRVTAHYAASQQLAGLALTTGGDLTGWDGAGRGQGSWMSAIRTGGRMAWTSPTVGIGAPARVRFRPHPADYV